MQAIARWGRKHGVIPDDVPWSDPFASMKLKEDESDRAPFPLKELQTLFSSPVFVEGNRPKGGKGEAAFWLPLLGLFTGARRGELAALTAGDVQKDEWTKHLTLVFNEDKARNKTLKTRTSSRTVPVHPELVRLGFLKFAEELGRAKGDAGWLFPEISLEAPSGAKAWSKWFGRYLSSVGITDTDKVFHSLRHNLKDALRAAKVPEDMNDALLGQGRLSSVGRRYGAKKIVQRFGLKVTSGRCQREVSRCALQAYSSGTRASQSKRQTARGLANGSGRNHGEPAYRNQQTNDKGSRAKTNQSELPPGTRGGNTPSFVSFKTSVGARVACGLGGPAVCPKKNSMASA